MNDAKYLIVTDMSYQEALKHMESGFFAKRDSMEFPITIFEGKVCAVFPDKLCTPYGLMTEEDKAATDWKMKIEVTAERYKDLIEWKTANA